jgi:outer membrane lipoprotein-sorting protein
MTRTRRLRALRWALPVAVVAVLVGIANLAPTFAAGSTPTLPALTPAQLLDKARASDVRALTGTIRLTTRLGIPSLGSLQLPNNLLTDLLSGSHEARVWAAGPDRVRIALIDSLAETDLVRNGQDLWLWQSDGHRVAHARLADDAASTPNAVPQPDVATQAVLDQITPSTALSVRSPEYVAGRAAYELVVAPRSAASLVRSVEIAVDAVTGLPLRVAVTAKGATKPAIDLGFSSLSLRAPAASTFRFVPPKDARVREADGVRDLTRPADGATPAVVGNDWERVVVVSGATLPPQANAVLRSASRVSGAFGSGRLIQTPLVSALVLDDGRVAVGAVTPARLEAAVASVR